MNNGYFLDVVEDAIKDLEDGKGACVFYEEQVQAVKDILKKDIKVRKSGSLFYLTLENDKK